MKTITKGKYDGMVSLLFLGIAYLRFFDAPSPDFYVAVFWSISVGFSISACRQKEKYNKVIGWTNLGFCILLLFIPVY